MKDKFLYLRTLNTRQYLIDAAGELFAEKGFEGTSIRNICQLAQVNIASTHYHFGSKAGLYHAVLACCMEQEEKAFPKPKLEPETDPDVFLQDYIFMLLSRVTRSPRPDWQTALLRREIFAPSLEFIAFMEEHMFGPDFRLFMQVFQRICPAAGPDALHTAVKGVFGMISSYILPFLPFEKFSPPREGPKGKMTEAECMMAAFFIAQSCSAGLRILSAQSEAERIDV